nr:hypothetical protein SHINE37_41423 [Rhizobiaceae bacterium]
MRAELRPHNGWGILALRGGVKMLCRTVSRAHRLATGKDFGTWFWIRQAPTVSRRNAHRR